MNIYIFFNRNIVNILILPKLSYRVSTIIIKIPMEFLWNFISYEILP